MSSVESRIQDLTQVILDDYKKGRHIDKKNRYNDPNKEEIVKILNEVQQLIFPGYFRNEHYRIFTSENHVSMLLEDVLFRLSKQISVVLKYVENPDGNSEPIHTREELREQAREIALQFLNDIPRIREYMETDIEAGYMGDPAAYNRDEIVYSYPGFYAIMVHRIANSLHRLNVPMIPRIMSEYAHSLTGVDIHPGATIGKYFFIDHATGIVIGETTIIGEHVKVYQGVTLGALSTRAGQALKSVRRHPTIEDNVTIYSGASILGGNTVIGEGSIIGGNVFITSSIPKGTKVSVKSQELVFNYASKKPDEKKEVSEETSLFETI